MPPIQPEDLSEVQLRGLVALLAVCYGRNHPGEVVHCTPYPVYDYILAQAERDLEAAGLLMSKEVTDA